MSIKRVSDATTGESDRNQSMGKKGQLNNREALDDPNLVSSKYLIEISLNHSSFESMAKVAILLGYAIESNLFMFK